jgi:nucleotide-binding universal stress UspA family protein
VKIAIRQLLVPTDFSDESGAAMTYGVALAEQFNASLHLLHIVESIVAGEALPLRVGPAGDLDTAVAAAAWKDLRDLLTSADHKRLRAELALEWGIPSVEIVRYAKAHEIDLIAMGTHGRGGIKHLVMGSVAENVVRSAPCPVLTVRHPEHEFVVP